MPDFKFFEVELVLHFIF